MCGNASCIADCKTDDGLERPAGCVGCPLWQEQAELLPRPGLLPHLRGDCPYGSLPGGGWSPVRQAMDFMQPTCLVFVQPTGLVFIQLSLLAWISYNLLVWFSYSLLAWLKYSLLAWFLWFYGLFPYTSWFGFNWPGLHTEQLDFSCNWQLYMYTYTHTHTYIYSIYCICICIYIYLHVNLLRWVFLYNLQAWFSCN
jgi:hypothetical protein